MPTECFVTSPNCKRESACVTLGCCQAALVINSEIEHGNQPEALANQVATRHCDHPERDRAVEQAEIYLACYGSHYYQRAVEAIVAQLDSWEV